MMKKFISQKGYSLVELLAALAIMSIVSIGIGSYLISGKNSFDKVNEEVNLKSEANIVMKTFENHIFAAKSVDFPQECYDDSTCTQINIVELYEDPKTGDLKEKNVTLGFKDQQAIVDGTPIHSSQYKIEKGEFLKPEKIGDNKYVIPITIEMNDKKNNITVKLENRFSYIQSSDD